MIPPWHSWSSRTASPPRFGTLGDIGIAIGLLLTLFPPLTGADLYLSGDVSGKLPVNATAISFLCLSSAFGLILLFGLARDRAHSAYLTFVGAAPVLVVFSLLTIVQLVGGFLPAADWSGGGELIYLTLYSFVILVFSIGIASSRVFQRYHRVIFAICLLAAAGSIFVDVFHPHTFSKLYTRPAGFMKGSNAGAETVILLTIATVDWRRNRASDMLVWMVSGSAVTATLSRHGIVLFAVVFLLYSLVIARLGLRLFAKRFSMLLVAVAIVAALYSMTSPGSTAYSGGSRRLQLLAGYLEGETANLTEDSRVKLIFHYMNLISERPLLGYGTSFVKSVSRDLQATGPHNTFLTLWVENGVLGLAAYLMLLLVAFCYFRNLGDTRGQVLCAGVLVISFFNQSMFTMRPLIVALGLLSALAALESSAGSKPARSSTRWRTTASRKLPRPDVPTTLPMPAGSAGASGKGAA